MNKILVVFSLFLFVNAQSQKEITSKKRTSSITLDGKLIESDWQNANWSS